MPSRSLPHIEADLIRLADVLEREAALVRSAPEIVNPLSTSAEECDRRAALIEEARLVVRQATRDAPPLTAPAPTNAWTLFTMVLGLVAASAMLTFDINPITVALITGGIWYGTSYSINSWSRK